MIRPALTLVSAWISQLARDVRIDASLLATRSDLVSFLRNDAGARLSRGWRAAVVGEAVQKLVRGDAALAFEAGGSLTLELRSRQPIGPIIPVPDVSWGDPDVLAAP